MRDKVPKHGRIKEGRIKTRLYMEWICTKPCLVCGVAGVQAHHPINSIKFPSRGKYGKAHDTETVPLCFPHHQELHVHIGDEAKFEDKYGLDFLATVNEYKDEYLTFTIH
jgi:hypothetical protein